MDAEKIQHLLVMMITLILSICVHEFGHAWVADKLGDRLPRMQGRVTLNPMAHADPWGTLLIPAIFIWTTGGIGFGWGKPVQHRTFDRKKRLLIAAAGPLMNLFFGMFIAVLLTILLKLDVGLNPMVYQAMWSAVMLNFVLFFFNLLPTPPLDGGSVVAGLLPARALPAWERWAVYAPFIFLAFIMINQLAVVFMIPAEWLAHVWGGVVLGLPV